MWQDIRLAVRGFRKTPVFTIVAILTLALSTGATTAVFSILNALTFHELDVRNPQTLVQISGSRPGSATRTGLTFRMYEELKRRQPTFSAVLGWLGPSINVIDTGGEQTQGAVWVVSGNFYDELGVRPLAGRLLNEQDADERTLQPAHVAVLGHAFWIRHFGGDRNVVGQQIRVENEWFQIVGIAPEGFRALNVTIEPDVTLPLTAFPLITDGVRGADLRSTPSFWVRATGRLHRGITIEQARAAVDTMWPELMGAAVPPAFSGPQRDRFLEVRPSLESAAFGIEPLLRETYISPLVVVFAIAGLILLIACVNLASLLLARVATRAHEMGVRLALGAGRVRLVRQLFVEGLLLSSVGAASGVWVAYWCSDIAVTAILRDYAVAASLPVAPDARVIGVAVVLATLTGTLVSLAPVWLAARLETSALLQGGTRTTTTSARALRTSVGAQVGLSVVLLISAGLLVRTLQEIRSVPSGMRPDDVFLASLAPLPDRREGLDNDTYYPALLDQVRSLAGVERAGAALARPAGGSGPSERVSKVEDPHDRPGIESLFMAVSPGVFATLDIPIKAGRDFGWNDTSRSHAVAVISDSLARRLFSGTSAIGQRIRVGVSPGRQDVEVVGVVADARLYDVKDANVAAVYVPALQDPNNVYKSLIVRGARASADDLNRVVASLGRDRVRFTRTLNYVVGRTQLRERIIATLAAFFGGMALLLLSIGVYGLMSYVVAQRQREIGIRMALGADARTILSSMVRQGMTITFVGTVAGLVAAFTTVRLVRSLLFGVSAYDPVTIIIGLTVLIGVAASACVIPAVRAARTDPMVALRAE
jgi:putative ABC transport system permease protein